MKTLILGPMDYPTARLDLNLANYNHEVYSTYYTYEGMYATTTKEGKMLEGGTMVSVIYLSERMTDKEYECCPILFGLVPKRLHIDRVICYNYDTLSSQEALLTSVYPQYAQNFYSTADITDRCSNIMEAIKLAQSPTKESD